MSKILRRGGVRFRLAFFGFGVRIGVRSRIAFVMFFAGGSVLVVSGYISGLLFVLVLRMFFVVRNVVSRRFACRVVMFGIGAVFFVVGDVVLAFVADRLAG